MILIKLDQKWVQSSLNIMIIENENSRLSHNYRGGHLFLLIMFEINPIVDYCFHQNQLLLQKL